MTAASSVVIPIRPPAPGSAAGSEPREIEIKFDIDPSALSNLETALTRLGGTVRSRSLISTYYDDADETLRKAGFTLRIRQTDGGAVQTIKSDAGGELFERGEWETALSADAAGAPDLDTAARTPLKPVLARAGLLRPAFTSRVERLQRTIDYAGGEIELALDKGELEADGGRRAPVCQLELELKRGQPELLFRLAKTLAAQAPLRLSFDTKAGLGYALLGPPQDAGAAAKGAAAAIHENMTATQAFQAVARAALRQIVANERIVRARRASEALHQLRVGLRRLRTALTLWGPVVTDGRFEAIKAELKWLSGQLDEVRDADVFIAETYQPAVGLLGQDNGLPALGKALKLAQTRGYDHALKALKSRRGQELTLTLAEWIEAGDWLSADAAAAEPAPRFAKQVLTRLYRKIEKRGADLQALVPSERHKLRIVVKKLRYGLEFFSDLYRPKKTKAFVNRLRTFQDTLGELNDIAVARKTAAGLAVGQPTPEVAYAAGLVAGLRAGGESDRLAKADADFAVLVEGGRPW